MLEINQMKDRNLGVSRLNLMPLGGEMPILNQIAPLTTNTSSLVLRLNTKKVK